MKLILQRQPSTPKSTPGELFLYAVHEAYTLEDPVRPDPNPATPENEAKIPGETAIPAGTYKVIVNESPRFKRLLPRLVDVPGFAGVLIHPGNTPEDTHGCILVGQTRDTDKVLQSKAAFEQLFNRIQAALVDGEEVWIEVRSA